MHGVDAQEAGAAVRLRAAPFADARHLRGLSLDLSSGYGVPAMNGLGLFTPYGGYALAGSGSHHYRLGGRWEIGQTFYLNLELARRESGSQMQNLFGLKARREC